MSKMIEQKTVQILAKFIYGAAAAAIAVTLTLIFWEWIAPNSTGLFLAAVAVTAWQWGVYPSLLTTFLSVLLIDYFFNPPLFAFEISADNFASTTVFVTVALIISWIDSQRTRALLERDRLLENEQQLRAAAEDANCAKDHFLAMVTHELRAPLNVILGWLQILRKGTPDEIQVQKAYDAIERNALQQQQLVSDLLDISLVRAGRFRINPRPTKLFPILNEAIEIVAPAISAKGIWLQTSFDEDLLTINGDAGRLRQVFWNLLSNSVKFTPENGQIEVCLERVNSHARIIFYDTGVGISPEFLPFVFDRFSQSNENAQNKHGGLGLGLAIARHLVEAHGGTVKAESAGINLGATFTVELPLLDSTDETANKNEANKLKNPLLAEIGKNTNRK